MATEGDNVGPEIIRGRVLPSPFLVPHSTPEVCVRAQRAWAVATLTRAARQCPVGFGVTHVFPPAFSFHASYTVKHIRFICAGDMPTRQPSSEMSLLQLLAPGRPGLCPECLTCSRTTRCQKAAS